MTPPQPAGAGLTGVNYGASSVTANAVTDASAAYASLVARAAASSTPIAPVMDSTRRFPGVYKCIPYCNLGGGVLTLGGCRRAVVAAVSVQRVCVTPLGCCLSADAQGDPSAVFIFVTSGYLAASPASQMSLVNGARSSNGALLAVILVKVSFTQIARCSLS